MLLIKVNHKSRNHKHSMFDFRIKKRFFSYTSGLNKYVKVGLNLMLDNRVGKTKKKIVNKYKFKTGHYLSMIKIKINKLFGIYSINKMNIVRVKSCHAFLKKVW